MARTGDAAPGGGDEADEKSDSRVGKKLQDLTIKRVVVLVMAMLMITPQMSYTAW